MFDFVKKLEDMSDGQIRKEVSKRIAAGILNKRQLSDIIQYLESNRPEIFNSEIINFKKIKEKKLWDKEYLNLIHNSIICGYFCKEILFHMQEVSNKLLFKYRVGACCVVVTIIGIVVFLVSCIR